MGTATSVELRDADREAKLLRQLREQYRRLKDAHVSNDELVQAIEATYERIVLRSTQTSPFQVPHVRFGRTELQMPIVTCGGMRQQETWRPREGFAIQDVRPDIQANFQAIVDHCMAVGINHFETAYMYGSSQLQFGRALKKYPRETYILQTKVNPQANTLQFRDIVLRCFELLDCEYLDLFAFHGINREHTLEYVGRPGQGRCYDVIKELQRAGKIRHIGFSTHAHTPLIIQTIETGIFDYVNLHYQYVGSYHATGTGGALGPTNLACVQAANRLDMGVFIISPVDKGGQLWRPSRTFASICESGGLSPIAFNNLWIWAHKTATGDHAIHTLSVGAARPSDFDEHVESAKMLNKAAELTRPVDTKLQELVRERLGEDWLAGWWIGVPGCYEEPNGIFLCHIVWLYMCVVAWGMWDFARTRYEALEMNLKVWDNSKTADENRSGWGYVPGCAYRPDKEAEVYAALCNSPRRERVMQAVKDAHEWLATANADRMETERAARGWERAYDLQPSLPYPERP